MVAIKGADDSIWTTHHFLSTRQWSGIHACPSLEVWAPNQYRCRQSRQKQQSQLPTRQQLRWNASWRLQACCRAICQGFRSGGCNGNSHLIQHRPTQYCSTRLHSLHFFPFIFPGTIRGHLPPHGVFSQSSADWWSLSLLLEWKLIYSGEYIPTRLGS